MPEASPMRIPGAVRGKKILVTVDGRSLSAVEGETVHALLTAHGIYAMGYSRKTGRARGALCGMGVCYECRVTVNGVPDQQACTTQVKDQMEIKTHDHRN